MAETRSVGREALRRLRKFVLIVIWVVPLLYFSVFMNVVTGAAGVGADHEYGAGIVKSCVSASWNGMPLGYECRVEVTWEDGDRDVVTVPPADLEPAEVGRSVEVAQHRENGNYEVRVDQSHPWAWVWWLTGAPTLCLALGLIALGVYILIRGRFLPERDPDAPPLHPFSRKLRERRA